MDNATKLIASITGLLVAAGALFATLSGGSDLPVGITVILDSPEAFELFIRNHPAAG